ncbi:MAG: VCBS repeat-containing protein [Candidatus Omnitrophica bacterium]|nr:VCBS repeat-containing protein [Candidatus Omnitrophota bacterium]
MKFNQSRKDIITFSAFLFLFVFSVIFCSSSIATEWQQEYGVEFNGSYSSETYRGGLSYSQPSFVDIDNDGDYDMFMGQSSRPIWFYRNDGTAISSSWTFVTKDCTPDIDKNSPYTNTFCDIDDDGDYDMFVGSWNGTISFYQNDGTSSSPSWAFITDNYNSINVEHKSTPTFCDIDNDGDYDMFVGSVFGDVYFYRNDGTPSVASWALISTEYNSYYASNSVPVFCDIDNDGDFDMFIGTDQGTILFYENIGTPTSPNWWRASYAYANLDVGEYCVPRFCDIDGDGDYDLFLGDMIGNVRFYKNTGTPTSPSWSAGKENYLSIIDNGSLGSPVFCDIDGDDDYDMFSGQGYGAIYFYKNNGTADSPAWTLVDDKFIVLQFDSPYRGYGLVIPTLCDIDGDGDSDIFIGTSWNTTAFYRNDGTINSPSMIFINDNYFSDEPVSSRRSAPALCDIDHDGDYDFFIAKSANYEGNGNICFYRNDGTLNAPLWTLVTENYASFAGERSPKLTFCDIDNDGDYDMFIGGESGVLTLYQNDGTPYSPSWTLITDNYESIDVLSYSAPAFCDIDNDEDYDMFVGEIGGGIYFWRNTSVDNIAPAPVTNFSAQPGIEHIILNWTNPTDADWAGTIIMRKEGDYPQYVNDGTVTYDGKNSSCMDINYTLPGITYYYTAFAYDSKRNYSEVVPSAQGMAAALESPFQREYGAKVNGNYLPGAYLGQVSEAHPILADMDNDGDMDMLVGTKKGYIQFYRNDGDSYTPHWVLISTNYDSDKGLWAREAISLCDIDGDGDDDMFVGGQSGTVDFYRKDEDLWVYLWDFGPIDVGDYSEPVLCDIDNDGDYDMFVGEQYGRIYFYRNDGSAIEPSFILISSNYESIDVGDRSVPTFCDIDSDDDYDMFIGNSAGKINFYRNDGIPGSPAWTFVTNEYNSIDVGNNSTLVFCDINSDGDYDMFAGNGNGDILFYENNGSPTSPSWDFVINYTHIDVDSNSVPVFCDIDGDGDLDMFISNWNGAITLYRNDGTGASPSWIFVTDKYNSIERQTYIMPSFCDIDNDGDYDMFIGDIGGQIDFYRNNGTATEAIWAQKIFNYANIDVGSYSSSTFCDIDNDGDYDLFVGNIYGDLYFYCNDGTPSEPQWTLVSDNYGNFNIGFLIRPSFGDIDGDGDYDMCIGNERAHFYSYRGITDLFENIGSPESPSWEYMMTINYPFYKGAYSAPTLCDIDKDGDADLFVGDRGGYLGFWRNMTITNTPPEVTISSIIPNPAYKGDNVTFTGTAEDEGDEIIAYKWISSIDGLLSESASFSTNSLSLGTHTITFEAQDNHGAWSEPAITILEVRPLYELSLKNGDTVSGNVYVTMTCRGTTVPYFAFMVDQQYVSSNPWRTQYFLNGPHIVYCQYPDFAARTWRKTDPITINVNNSICYIPKIVSPSNGSEVSGNVNITFRTDGGQAYFAFIYANNKLIGWKNLYMQQSPHTFTWQTAKIPNGQYDLRVVAYYFYVGATKSESVRVIVNNSTIPTPIINLTCPNPASGIVNVHISSNDDIDFFAPTLYVDGKFISFKWWMPCNISWDTRKFTNGPHKLHFQAYYRPLKKWLVVEKIIEVRN